MEFIEISESNYSAIYDIIQTTDFGSMLLPQKWQPSLWGICCYENDLILATWIGTKRIKNKALKFFYQEVTFNSQPIFFSDSINKQMFVSTVYERAKKNGISAISVSHWSRGSIVLNEKCATFVVNLYEENLFSLLEPTQRNKVRKGDKAGIECKVIASKKEMLTYLNDFQRLRKNTQQRAIENNAKASMLLKSNSFFENVFTNYNVLLGVAEHNGTVVSVALAMISGKTIYYYSGGSDIELNRKTGASALLIWRMIEYAKQIGLKYFDMGGVPVSPDNSHPAYGVYMFKKSYGGIYREYTYGDIVLSKVKYKMISFLKNNRVLLRLISSKM